MCKGRHLLLYIMASIRHNVVKVTSEDDGNASKKNYLLFVLCK